jgi:hypothetical protein
MGKEKNSVYILPKVQEPSRERDKSESSVFMVKGKEYFSNEFTSYLEDKGI